MVVQSGLLLGLLLAAEIPRTGSLVVTTSADVGAPCPAGRALALTLQRRLPAVPVATDAALADGDLGVSLSADGDAWRLRVERTGGEVILARDVRPAESTCAAVAETCVLILDRFLTAISWRGQEAALESGALVPRQPPPPVRTAGVALAVGMAAWMELPTDAAPALSVDLSVRWGSFLAGVWGAGQERRAQAISGGAALRARRLLLGGSFGVCRPTARVDLCAGALGGAGVLTGGSEGTLAEKSTATAVVPVAGVFGRVVWPLGAGFELSADLTGLAPLGVGELGVAGSGAAARSPRVYGMAAGRLGWRL
jgi:hypothetical protein